MNLLSRLTFAAGLALAASAAWAANDTPAGTWRQVDDATGKVKSIIEITDQDGQFLGKVVKVMNLSPEEIARDGEHPRCTKCDGERKNQPIEGMTILWGVTKNEGYWGGGNILDPKSGKTYKVKLSLKDGGEKLDVHGYIGFSLLGRSQTWIREH